MSISLSFCILHAARSVPAVLQVNANMPDAKNHSGNHQPKDFPVYAKQEKCNNRQNGTGEGDTEKTTVKVDICPLTFKISNPPKLIQKNKYRCGNQPQCPSRPSTRIKVCKNKRCTNNKGLPDPFDNQQDLAFVFVGIFLYLNFCPYQVGDDQQQ